MSARPNAGAALANHSVGLFDLSLMPQLFIEREPELQTFWRAAILLGRNSASFKFALGNAILELAADGTEFVTLEELAAPYSHKLREHLRQADRQGTSSRSRFLDTLRAANRRELSDEEAATAT